MEPAAPTMPRRAAIAALALGAVAWALLLGATGTIPSPARETRFVDAKGPVSSADVRCHGAMLADGARVWFLCERASTQERALARFDVASGRAVLLGPLPSDAFALMGAVRGPNGALAVLLGDTLHAVEGDAIRRLGKGLLPLGLARVGDAIELLDRSGDGGVRVQRFAAGGVAERRLAGLEAAPERTVQLEHAWHDGRAWRIVASDRPKRADALPIAVAIRERREGDEPRTLETLPLEAPAARLSADGTTHLVLGWLQDGAVFRGSLGLESVYLRRGERFEPVRVGEHASLETAGAVLDDAGRTRLLITEAIGERFFWLDGTRIDRVAVDRRWSALRVGEKTGPRLVRAFWIEPATRVLPAPAAEGGYLVLGALGGAYVRVGRDLERTDGLSFGERFRRLFVEDRAKRNVDFFHGIGGLRAAAIPLGLCGPLFGLAALRLARRRPRVASALAFGWLAAAALAAWHFVYVLRFYW